jgi:hypothetical protein
VRSSSARRQCLERTQFTEHNDVVLALQILCKHFGFESLQEIPPDQSGSDRGGSAGEVKQRISLSQLVLSLQAQPLDVRRR